MGRRHLAVRQLRDRDLFVKDPTAYAPQFGGLCTEGVAFGEITVNLTPESFAIVDGKLYMNSATSFAEPRNDRLVRRIVSTALRLG